MGDNLSRIFHSFITHGIKVNLVEASAVSIDVCVDDERPKVDSLINDLKEEYSAVYNENVEMLSVRHYTPEAMERITKGREILLEQRTRSTVRFVVRKNGINGDNGSTSSIYESNELTPLRTHGPMPFRLSVKHQSLSPVILIY